MLKVKARLDQLLYPVLEKPIFMQNTENVIKRVLSIRCQNLYNSHHKRAQIVYDGLKNLMVKKYKN